MMMSLERNGSAVLAPSRTLRAGYAGAVIRHSGRRWRAALWRSPGRDEGMAGWVEQRDGLWRGHSSSDGSGPHGMVRIEDGLPIQHGAGHGEQTIGQATATRVVPCTGALGATPHWTSVAASLPGHNAQARCSKHKGRWVAPGKLARSVQSRAQTVPWTPWVVSRRWWKLAARVRKHGGRVQAARSRLVGERSRVCQPSTRRMVI